MVDENTEETPTDVKGSESAGTEEAKGVPYERFNEVNAGLKDAKTEIETLKSEMESLKGSQTFEEETPADWKEVSEIASKKAVETIRAERIAEEERETVQEQAIESKFEQLKSLGHEVTDEIRATILKELIKSGTNNPDDVVKIYLKQKEAGQETERIDESKTVVSKGKGGEQKSGEFTYAETRALRAQMDI